MQTQPASLERRSIRALCIAALLGAACLLAGCATPVGVRQVDVHAAYRIHTESALSEEQPSEPSKMVLRRLGLLDRFEAEPAQVLAELHAGLLAADDEDRLFALAELSFLHADRTRDRAYFLASAVYAWALLFPGEGIETSLLPSDPRRRLTYDLYNQAIAKGLQRPRSRRVGQEEVLPQSGFYTLPFGRLYLSVDPSGLTWGGYRLDRFVPTTTLEVRGLRNRYRTPGIGAPLAASLAQGPAAKKMAGSERLGPRIKVPVTALLRFENARAGLASGRIEGRLEIYAADQTETVSINGVGQPLESDPTAALAYQLEGNPLYDLEIAGFLRGGAFRGMLPRDRIEDGLAFMQPYKPGKIPLVLVHGTASSPARWAELVNELEGDPHIRRRFQIWLFFYDTGNPVAYSAGRLRTALTTVVNEFDPEGKDRSLRNMVVIGHSQGGLLTKLTAVDSGTRFWDRVSSKPFESIQVDAETRELFRQSAFFKPLPFVGRVVFVATPHKGALLAGGRIGALAASLVTLPVDVFGRAAEAVTLTGDEKLITVLRRPPTAVDNMNPDHPGLKLLQSLRIDPRIPAHSIIAVEGDGPKEEGDDGVVAYSSAHIEEAVSERVIRSDHSCQGHPDAIEEIRRILLQHAREADERQP